MSTVQRRVSGGKCHIICTGAPVAQLSAKKREGQASSPGSTGERASLFNMWPNTPATAKARCTRTNSQRSSQLTKAEQQLQFPGELRRDIPETVRSASTSPPVVDNSDRENCACNVRNQRCLWHKRIYNNSLPFVALLDCRQKGFYVRAPRSELHLQCLRHHECTVVKGVVRGGDKYW